MSCPHPLQLSAYADGGLEAASVRALEAHLVGCARCRRGVLAQRDEARVLRDLLHERLPAPPPAAEAARGIAFGLPISIAALALASFGAGALLESLPRPLRWLAPESLGVTQMLVDLFWTVRNNWAAWLDFGFAVAVLGAVAALGYFAVDVLSRRARGASRSAAALCLVAAAALAPREAEAAFELREADDGEVKVAREETVQASLLAFGDVVTIDGTIAGDLVAFGETVRVRGSVQGNVFCAGADVEVAGTVSGSVHCAGQSVRVEAGIAGNLYVAGEDVSLQQAARVGADMASAGESVQVDGEVARDLFVAGESATIGGRVGRDLSAHAGAVEFLATASAPGNVELHLPEGEEPTIAAGATLGTISRHVMDGEAPKTPLRRISQFEFIRGRVMLAVSAFVVGLVLFALTPGLFATRVDTAGRFFTAVGAGLAALFLLTVLTILLLVSVIGIPVALFVMLGIAAVVFLGPVVVAAVVGRSVMRSSSDSTRDFAIALLVGVVLTALLISLPVVGGFAFAVLIFEGIGLLALEALDWWNDRRAARVAARISHEPA
jgi:anti-sigma factor RsiW